MGAEVVANEAAVVVADGFTFVAAQLYVASEATILVTEVDLGSYSCSCLSGS